MGETKAQSFSEKTSNQESKNNSKKLPNNKRISTQSIIIGGYMNNINIIELDQKTTNCTICNAETPISYSIPMYEGKKVDTTKSDEWAGMPVCKLCYYDDALVRGRVFGVNGNVRKAVVLKTNKKIVTWSFLNSEESGVDTIKAISDNSDWIGDIDMGFLREVEFLKDLDQYEHII